MGEIVGAVCLPVNTIASEIGNVLPPVKVLGEKFRAELLKLIFSAKKFQKVKLFEGKTNSASFLLQYVFNGYD